MIPVPECILKRNELMIYKGSVYCIYFKLSGKSFSHMIYKGSMYCIYFKLSAKSFPHITTKEYNLILNVFDVVSSIYNKYKPKSRKCFLNYPFVLKQT